MKRNLKSEMKQSMDALRFSEEEKEAMVYDLLEAAEKTGRPSGKKFIVIALAACLVLYCMKWRITSTNIIVNHSGTFFPHSSARIQRWLKQKMI